MAWAGACARQANDVRANPARASASPEVERDSCREAQVVLIAILRRLATLAEILKPRHQIVELDGAKHDVLVNFDIQAAAQGHCEVVLTGRKAGSGWRSAYGSGNYRDGDAGGEMDPAE